MRVVVEVDGRVGCRLPLDNGTGADATTHGGIDRTLLSCEGQASRCVRIGRWRGRKLHSVPKAERRIFTGRSSRRRGFDAQSAADDASRDYSDTDSWDDALLINLLLSRDDDADVGGGAGDYVRKLNISGTQADVSGALAVSAWIRADADTAGWLLATVDAAFYGDGTTPALERAAHDVVDRDMAASELRLQQGDLAVYSGMLISRCQRERKGVERRASCATGVDASRLTLSALVASATRDRLCDDAR